MGISRGPRPSPGHCARALVAVVDKQGRDRGVRVLGRPGPIAVRVLDLVPVEDPAALVRHRLQTALAMRRARSIDLKPPTPFAGYTAKPIACRAFTSTSTPTWPRALRRRRQPRLLRRLAQPACVPAPATYPSARCSTATLAARRRNRDRGERRALHRRPRPRAERRVVSRPARQPTGHRPSGAQEIRAQPIRLHGRLLNSRGLRRGNSHRHGGHRQTSHGGGAAQF
jgi:hypothetical protein